MAKDRSVKVKLSLDYADYVSGLGKASAETKAFSEQVDKLDRSNPSINVDTNAKKTMAEFQAAARAGEGLNSELEKISKSTDDVGASMKHASSDTAALTASARKLEDASARVTIAQKRLEEVQKTSEAGSSKRLAAENMLRKALRDRGDAANEAALAMDALRGGTDEAAKASEDFGSSSRGNPALLAAIAAGALLVGPAVGAASAAVIGFTGVLGVGLLAYRGFTNELASGSQQGKELQGQLDNISASFDHLGSVAAAGASTGVISALSQVDAYLGKLDGPVAVLASDLGDALSITADALITGLETAAPLMDDMGGYAKSLAQHLDDFAHSQAFEDFLAYAQAELPQVATMLADVGQAVVDLAIALAPAGESLVTDLDAIAKGISAVSKASHYLHEINSLGGLLDFGPPKEAAKGLDTTASSGKKAADALKAVNAMLHASSAQAAVTAPIVDAFGNVLYDVDGKATDAQTAIQNLENSIRGLGNTSLDVRASTRDFQGAIDDVTAAAKKNGKTLSEDTYAGRENAAALDRIATTSHGVTAALIANHASQKKVTASMKEGRTAYINAAIALGSTRGEAKRLADQAGFTAGDVRKVNDALRAAGKLHPRPTIRVDAAGAISVIDQVRSAINSLHDRHITITTTQQNNFNRMAAGRTQYQADGAVMDFFANGAENHVAQIAPAGSMRVWAEPETGGEAYIPLAPSKRARSEDILAATAARFGKVVVDAERRYASGALVDYPRFSAIRAQAAPVAGAVTVAAPTPALDGMRIEGVLDLGNGLQGYVDGRITRAGRRAVGGRNF